MTEATIMIDPADVSSFGSETTSGELGYVATARPLLHSIPRSQAYYWTRAWQSGEHESVTAIEEGRGVRFASGAELADWLLSQDDDGPE